MEEIREIVSSILSEDQFLVDIVHKGGYGSQKLLVLVDSDSGLTIDDCAQISRNLSDKLEEQDFFDSKYLLEVSSPGLDHPIHLTRQFKKNIGRSIEVQTNEGNEMVGKLNVVENDFIELQQNNLKKGVRHSKLENIRLSFTDIKTAKVLISFKN